MNCFEHNDLLIYQDKEGNIIVDAIYKDETLWLTQKAMSKVFDCSTDNISLHLKNIFKDKELNENSVTEESSITASDGKKYKTKMYNLDAIIAVGYRINSKKATEFRIWATKILKEYMTKGFALNDERFIKGNKYDTKYFEELLERIKTIRVSERMAYQKITDLFIATSTDYNPKSVEAYTFFKIVQNKLHYAISGHTAAELIYERADSSAAHMGLTNWKNSPDGLIYKYDVSIAKNYLNEEELNKLNDLTNLFLVFAEDEAKERHIMTMQDWITATDDLLKFRRKSVLLNSGSISHKKAIEKAENEYEKYRITQDQKYISSMDEFYNKYLEESEKRENGVEFTWIKNDYPKNIKIKQVYALAFSNNGNVLLRVENNHYKLTGGKPEKCDKSFEDTLKREYIEELNVELEDIQYLGYLLVEERKEKYAQVRMIAKIKEIGSIKPDIDNKKTYKRFMVNQKNVKKYLNYTDLAGNQMIDDAIELANRIYNFNCDNNLSEYFTEE